jgi:excisionase family DNA binding protein
VSSVGGNGLSDRPVVTDPLLTLNQTAERLGCSRSTVKRLINSQRLALVRRGSGRGRPFVPESSIGHYLSDHAVGGRSV